MLEAQADTPSEASGERGRATEMPQPGLRGEQGLCGQVPGLADVFPPTVPVTAAHGAGDGRSAPAVRASTAHRSSCQPVPSLLRWFCWHGGGGPAGAWMPGAGGGAARVLGSLPFSEKLRHQFRFRGCTEKRKLASLWQLPAGFGSVPASVFLEAGPGQMLGGQAPKVMT